MTPNNKEKQQKKKMNYVTTGQTIPSQKLVFFNHPR
jgi:hypothetical protein